MKLTTSVLKTAGIPNKHPQYPMLMLTFSTITYVFLGEAPDMNYEATADIIGAGYGIPVIIPKYTCCGKELSFYQTSGADAYVGMIEVMK